MYETILHRLKLMQWWRKEIHTAHSSSCFLVSKVVDVAFRVGGIVRTLGTQYAQQLHGDFAGMNSSSSSQSLSTSTLHLSLHLSKISWHILLKCTVLARNTALAAHSTSNPVILFPFMITALVLRKPCVGRKLCSVVVFACACFWTSLPADV